jgi:OmcA/MtrC family decaheme c-type cytochrome
MEFPYPMSMANCATCHDGKLTQVLADNQFKATTCKSCHPIQVQADYPTQANRAPALEAVWPEWHSIADDCSLCHQGQVAQAPRFSALHTGFNSEIYNASGQKYSSLYHATIDSISVTGNVMDVVFSTNNASITAPVVMIAFYGYETKNFIISARSKTIGGSGAGYTEVPRTDGKFEVKYDMASYTSTSTPSIPEMIAAGQIKKAEVAIRPVLKDASGLTVALDAVSQTFDFASNAVVANYYKGSDAIVSEAKCNACHDALATTFHSADRGGNIVVCRMCHVPTSGGSHLEMQSRSIDSYAHAIHSFQAFDSGDVDFTDPVEAARYGLHIEHVFPNFTIQNCKGCHVDGAATFNVPDQRESMGGLLSGSDTWNVARNIGEVPPYVTGPASRACGSCHRADFINEDEAGELVSLNGHVETNGYLVEDTSILYQAIDKIQKLFN